MQSDMAATSPNEFIIRYDGLDATHHEIELNGLAESLKGISKILGVCANFAQTQRFVQHHDALSVRVMARPPEQHCFEIKAVVESVLENSYLSATAAGLTTALVCFVFSWASGKREEMRQLRGALDVAIKELGSKDQATIDRMLDTIDSLAGALRPAAKKAVAPIGETAERLSIADVATGKSIYLGSEEKEAIWSGEEKEVSDEQTYYIKITNLDRESGKCKIRLMNEPEVRYDAKITDPIITVPNNAYNLAMSSHATIAVRGKTVIKGGHISEIYISDIDKS